MTVSADPRRKRKADPRIDIGGRMLRTSERSMFNRCRFQHDFAYEQRIKPKVESPALRFGTLIHQALELYYMTPAERRRRKLPQHPNSPADTFEQLYDAELKRTEREMNWRDEDGTWADAREIGVAMLTGYVERWRDNDKQWITLATEQTFRTPIIVPEGQPPLPDLAPTVYVGTFDRVLLDRRQMRLYLGDYKTTKNDPTKTKHLMMDEQAGAYWAFAPVWLHESAPAALQAQIRRQLRTIPPSVRKRLLSDDGELQFAGILYDFMRKGLPDSRPTNSAGHHLNKDGSVSKQQPPPLFHRETVYRDEADRQHVIQRVYEDACEIGQVRAGELPAKKSPDIFHCRLCAYYEMCELHETGADWTAYRDATTTTWDPFDAHELEDDAHEH